MSRITYRRLVAARLRPALAIAIAVAAAAGQAAAADYRVGPAPGWIDAVAASAEAGTAQAAYGVRYRLIDDQVRATAHERAHYHHAVEQAINEKGIDEIGHFEIDFDPSYQTLTLNQLDVVRDGARMPRLGSVPVKVLQRERDAESRIYDGRKSVELDLPDIRPGDIVDIAYTVSGANPVFAEHRFGGFDMQWGTPVEHLHRRLSVADGLPVHVAATHGAPEAEHHDEGGFQEWRWDERSVAPVQLDADSPDSYDPYAQVEWTDFADWGEVMRWAQPLFRVPRQPGPALAAEIARIGQEARTPEARAVAVLRWIQQHVRYLGIEMGASSHAPNAPDLVFARRFGDCKDKALLMVTMLRALGVDADPVLVNTRRRGELAAGLPMPAAFNHAIVVARLGGVDYWLDPTRDLQQGSLANVYQPAYGLALRLDGRTDSLSPMPPATRAVHAREVDVEVDASGGAGRPASYTVRTTYHRAAADEMRGELADGDREQLQHRYLNFYADTYPGIRVAAPMEVVDDHDANVLRVTERYVVDDPWTQGKRHDETRLWLRASELGSELHTPRDTIRRSPLAIDGPVEVAVHFDVKLPERWPIRKTTDEVRNANFALTKSTEYYGPHLHVDYRLEVMRDQVAPAAVPVYARDVTQARRLLSTTVSLSDAESAFTRFMKGAGLWIGLAVVVLLGWGWQRWMPPPPARLEPAADAGSLAPTSPEVAGAPAHPSAPQVREPFVWLALFVIALAMVAVCAMLWQAGSWPIAASLRALLLLPILGNWLFACIERIRQLRRGQLVPPPRSPRRDAWSCATYLALAASFAIAGDARHWLLAIGCIGLVWLRLGHRLRPGLAAKASAPPQDREPR